VAAHLRLGIRHVGERAAQVLAQAFGSIDALYARRSASCSRRRRSAPCSPIRSATGSTSRGIAVSSSGLRDRGLRMEVPPEERVARAAPGPLKGRTYVITGTLDAIPRGAARRSSARRQSGRSVSKKTTAVIVGADAGSKAAKARELGVPVLDEPGFLDLLNDVGRAG